MKPRERKNLLVTGFFLLILMALITAGIAPVSQAPEDSTVPSPERYAADSQFAQYLAYRVDLENSSNCQ